MSRNQISPVSQATVRSVAQQNYDTQLRHNKRVAAWNTFTNNATFIAFTGAFSALCVATVILSPAAYFCIRELKSELKQVYERELAQENHRTLREFEIALAEPEVRPLSGPMYRAWEEDGAPPSYAASVGEPPSYDDATKPEYRYDDVSMISFEILDDDSNNNR